VRAARDHHVCTNFASATNSYATPLAEAPWLRERCFARPMKVKASGEIFRVVGACDRHVLPGVSESLRRTGLPVVVGRVSVLGGRG